MLVKLRPLAEFSSHAGCCSAKVFNLYVTFKKISFRCSCTVRDCIPVQGDEEGAGLEMTVNFKCLRGARALIPD